MYDRQNGKIIWFMSPLHPSPVSPLHPWNKTNHWNPILYCWWLKSQTTTWDVWNPINTGINYQPQLVIAGFQGPINSITLIDHIISLIFNKKWCLEPRLLQGARPETLAGLSGMGRGKLRMLLMILMWDDGSAIAICDIYGCFQK